MQASEITHRTGNYYGNDNTYLIWEITDDQGIAAELYVNPDNGEIMNIEVRSDRRGEGLARALYEAASQSIDIYHAPEAHRTPEGHAFALAVGGDTIEYDCDCAGCNPITEDEGEDC